MVDNRQICSDIPKFSLHSVLETVLFCIGKFNDLFNPSQHTIIAEATNLFFHRRRVVSHRNMFIYSVRRIASPWKTEGGWKKVNQPYPTVKKIILTIFMVPMNFPERTPVFETCSPISAMVHIKKQMK